MTKILEFLIDTVSTPIVEWTLMVLVMLYFSKESRDTSQLLSFQDLTLTAIMFYAIRINRTLEQIRSEQP